MDGIIANAVSYMNTGGFIMWVIAFLSVVGVTIVLERLLFLMRSSSCRMQFKAPVGVSDVNLLRLSAESDVKAVLLRCERGLSFLAIIIKVAPMLGLLGTVLGMVKMFGALALTNAPSASAVTGGIREALFTTVAGLSCAVPLLLAHGLLSAEVEKRASLFSAEADRWVVQIMNGER